MNNENRVYPPPSGTGDYTLTVVHAAGRFFSVNAAKCNTPVSANMTDAYGDELYQNKIGPFL